MKYYELKLIETTVTEYNNDTQDWSGNRWYRGDDKVSKSLETLSKRSISKGVNDLVCVDINHSNFFNNGEYFDVSRIENDDSEEDSNGRYLVDYSFKITEVEEKIVDFDKVV